MEESLSKPFKPPKKLTPKKHSPEKKRVSFTKDTRSPENKFKMKHKERPKSHKIKIRVEMENKKLKIEKSPSKSHHSSSDIRKHLIKTPEKHKSPEKSKHKVSTPTKKYPDSKHEAKKAKTDTANVLVKLLVPYFKKGMN